jgi:hypothetical protein
LGTTVERATGSEIYYSSDEQRRVAEDTIADVEASGLGPGEVVTELGRDHHPQPARQHADTEPTAVTSGGRSRRGSADSTTAGSRVHVERRR